MEGGRTVKQNGFLNAVKRAFGFYKNPPYIEDRLKEADIRSAMFLSAVAGGIEIWMILRYINEWVLPGKVASVGEFFHYTSTYWYLLTAAVCLLIYSILYLKKKLRFLSKISRLVIFLYFSVGIYFGIVTSMKDFSKGRMITCFLTMLMYVTVICIWRPFTSLLLTIISGGLFIYFLNNYTYNKAGEQLVLSEGDTINYFTFLVILVILELAVYFQRYNDAIKSYKLELASTTDDLTGIPNMRKFVRAAKEYADACEKSGKTPVYLAFDIVHFQTFNDKFDYNGGDELLKKMAKIITEEFPDMPCARDSGDHFAVLAGSSDHKERAAAVREKVKALYPEENYLDVHIGACPAGNLAKDARNAVDRARYALKQLKPGDDAFFSEYDEKLSKDYSLRQHVLNHIDDAVREGHIKVYYQPVMWAEDGTLCGCEALARWDDPEFGFLSPGLFIPVLEDGRRIHKLDLCIYESVCRRIRECLDKGLPVIPTSMNFSRLDFELMDAVGELEALVEKYDIPKEYLHVEITESSLTNDVEGLKAATQRLHGNGYVIWLDDFGSGYSSLNVLKDFKFDLLKIDMEFLKNFSGNKESRIIIRNIISLAKELNMKTLTEGVETQEAVDFLKEAGCGRLQGYFFGKPMPYEDILDRINNGTYRLYKDLEPGR